MARYSHASDRIVRRMRNEGVDEWKIEVHYGRRWMVEIFFSALKRVADEIIRAGKLIYRIHKAVMKVYCYFILRKNTVVS